MRYILITFILSLLALNISSAQQPAAAKEETKGGIRFILREACPDFKEIYMVTGAKTAKKIILSEGRPSERVSIPKNDKVVWYLDRPVENDKQKPLFSADLPVPHSTSMIGLIGYKDGKFNIIFVDETNLSAGCILFKNLTNKDYLLQFPDKPAGDPEQHLLKGGTDFMMRKGHTPETTTVYRARIYHQIAAKNKAPEWFLERKMNVLSYSKRALIIFFLPASDGQRLLLHQIMLYDIR